MKQIVVFGKMEKVQIQEPKTLTAVLQETMINRGIPLERFDTVARNVIFNVDNVLVRTLNTLLKVGQIVQILPAVKAG